MMIFVNAVYKETVFPREYAEGFVKLLNPLAPHMTEELWSTVLGHNPTLANETWPTYDEEKTKDDEITIVIQINGKLRDKVNVSATASKEEIEAAALNTPRVKELLEGLTIRKVIVVPGKLVNIVAA